jgi:hypothetical protein
LIVPSDDRAMTGRHAERDHQVVMKRPSPRNQRPPAPDDPAAAAGVGPCTCDQADVDGTAGQPRGKMR